MASNGSHLTLQYGQDDTWGMAYNLYADKLIGANIFPQSIYDTRKFQVSSKVWSFSPIANRDRMVQIAARGIRSDPRHPQHVEQDWSAPLALTSLAFLNV